MWLDVLQLQSDYVTASILKAGGRPTEWQTQQQKEKKKKVKTGWVTPISSAMLWLHQIACIFGIHAHGVFSTNLSPQIR